MGLKILLLFFFFLLTPIASLSGLLGVPMYVGVLLIGIIIFSWAIFSRTIYYDKNFTLIIFLQIIILILHGVYNINLLANLNAISQLMTVPIIISLINSSKDGLIKFANYFINLMLFLGLTGFIQFILNGLDINLINYHFSDFSGHEMIWQGLSTVHENAFNFGEFRLYRMTLYFDEPGTASFFIGMAIIVNRVFNFKESNEKLLLFFGFFTLSFFYFLILAFYLILFSSKKSIIYYLFALFFLYFVIYILAYINDIQINAMYDFLMDRSFNRAINISDGDNRSIGFINSLNYIADSPFFGVGRENYNGITIGTAGYISYFAMFGFFGALILLLHIIYSILCVAIYGLQYKITIFYILFIIIMLGHREHVIQIFAYTLYYIVAAGAKKLGTSGRRI